LQKEGAARCVLAFTEKFNSLVASNMVSFIGLATAASLAAGQPVGNAQAATAQQGSVSSTRVRHEICHTLSTGAVYLNLADCLSFDKAPESVFRSHVCNFIRETGQLEDYELASHADCIRYGLAW
jgi:hypothetical protein